ncbi:MAG TPA: sugar ABC transporter permease, partial [Chloroflexota bacterium]|nr:sugar ABC transporter permease [Chloroflexota bacterium]
MLMAAAVARPRTTRAARRTFWEEVRRALPLYLLISPTFILLGIFNYYPAFMALYRSLFSWDIGGEATYIGLQNFVTMANDQVFRLSLWNVFQMTLAAVVIVLTVPVFVAEAIYRLGSQRAQYWYRILVIFPVVIPGVVHILIWQFFYESRLGLVNQLLRLIGFSGAAISWLGNPDVVVYAIIFSHFPFVGGVTVLIYLAGLQAIPNEIRDAAEVDGATGWTQVRTIDLAYLAGQIKLVVVLAIIGELQAFGYVLVMSGGGPANASMVPGLWLYTNLVQFGKVGYASAIGVFLF